MDLGWKPTRFLCAKYNKSELKTNRSSGPTFNKIFLLDRRPVRPIWLFIEKCVSYRHDNWSWGWIWRGFCEISTFARGRCRAVRIGPVGWRRAATNQAASKKITPKTNIPNLKPFWMLENFYSNQNNRKFEIIGTVEDVMSVTKSYTVGWPYKRTTRTVRWWNIRH